MVDQIMELKSQLLQKNQEVSILKIELNSRLIKINELEKERMTVYNSRSWKITQPLRLTSKFLQEVMSCLMKIDSSFSSGFINYLKKAFSSMYMLLSREQIKKYFLDIMHQNGIKKTIKPLRILSVIRMLVHQNKKKLYYDKKNEDCNITRDSFEASLIKETQRWQLGKKIDV